MKSLGLFVTVGAAGVFAAAIGGAARASSLNLAFVGFGPNLNTEVGSEASARPVAPAVSSFSGTRVSRMLFSSGFKAYSLQVLEGPASAGGSARWDVKKFYAQHYSSPLASAEQSAAFQVVLWELTHQTFDESARSEHALLAHANLAAGAFDLDASSSVYALANDYLDDLGARRTLHHFARLYGVTDPMYQELLAIVPVPAPILVAAVGLLGTLSLRRRLQ